MSEETRGKGASREGAGEGAVAGANEPSAAEHPGPAETLPPVRLRRPDREQMLPPMTVEGLVEADHPVRSVWRYCERLDLSCLYRGVRSRQGHPGRPPVDPRLLVALWLFALYDGVLSARRLAELTATHNAYRWLCGGVGVNHHLLSDFLVENQDFLQGLFQHSADVLRQAGLVSLDRLAQDGMRVRASAGAASFHRKETLQRQLEEAQALVECLQEALAIERRRGHAGVAAATEGQAAEQSQAVAGREDRQGPPGAGAAGTEPPRSKQQAAQLRAAVGKEERARHALERLPLLEAKKEPKDRAKARASSTDFEASVMKMANGGYNPAYNIHFCTDCQSQVIVGVEVVTTGSDQGQLKPMLDQVQARFGRMPLEVLADGGFVKLEEIEGIQKGEEGRAPVLVYAPVPKPKKEEVDRHQAKADDTPQVAEWRRRMGTDEAKAVYKLRAQTAECVNAQARNRGLTRLLVRGVEKVKSVALWFASAHNMARAFSLLPEFRPNPCLT